MKAIDILLEKSPVLTGLVQQAITEETEALKQENLMLSQQIAKLNLDNQMLGQQVVELDLKLMGGSL